MTSPSQLKYLKAMGIPVWVSRELLVVDKPTEQIENKDDSLKAVSNTVGSILQDLESSYNEQTTTPNSTENKAKAEKATLKPSVKEGAANEQPTSSASQSDTLVASTAQYSVYANGSKAAAWMVIGQSPEFVSDDSNQPYADDSGELLDNMLRAVGLADVRKQAYLVNVLPRSRTEDDYDDNGNQKLNKILLTTIQTVNPKIILIVGQLAAQNLLQSKEPLARLRAKSHQLTETNIPLVVTYYPSYLLSKPSDKRKAWEDLKLAMSLLAQ